MEEEEFARITITVTGTQTGARQLFGGHLGRNRTLAHLVETVHNFHEIVITS